MRKLLLLSFVIACVCALPQKQKHYYKHSDLKKHDYNLKINELKSSDWPDVKPGLSEALKGRAIDDCSLSVLFNQDLMNLCSDEIFAEVDDYISENLEPLDLPDENAGFSYTLIITFQGAINLTHGWLQDLSTLHRDGDVVIAADLATEAINLTLPVSLSRLALSYDYRAEIMGLGPEGGIEGYLDSLELSFGLSYDPVANKINLNTFETVKEGEIFVDFTGNPVVDWLADLLVDVVVEVLHSTVQNLVHEVVGGIVQSAVDALNDALANGDGLPTLAAPKLSQHLYKALEDNNIIH